MKKKKRQKGKPAQPSATPPIQHPPPHVLPISHLTIFLLLLVSLAVIPYLNTFGNQFALDDIDIIVKNPIIENVTNVGKIFATHYWGRGQNIDQDTDPGLYRPLTVFTYAIDYHFWKLDPTGYHLVNVLLHTAATLVFFIIAIDILESPMAAFGAAAIFAVHPVHTEAVTGIVGRAEILAAGFFLSAFWFARLQTISGSHPKPPASGLRIAVCLGTAALLYILGLFSKETAVTLPGVLLVYDWMHRDEILSNRNKRNSPNAPGLGLVVSRYIILGLVILVYFAFRSEAVTGHNIWVGFLDVSTGERIFTASRVLMEYLGLFVFPWTLRADYWYPEVPIARSPDEPLVFLSLMLWVALGIIAVYGLRKARPLFFSVALFFITILPVSNILFPIGVGKAERILYLPSAGFCIFVGWCYQRLEKQITKKWRLLPLLITILFLFAVRTYYRNADWKDDLTLALATLKVSPTSPLMNTRAALEYRKGGEQDKAIPLLEEAIRQRPDYATYDYELGLTYTQKGLLDQAMEEYRRAIKLRPDHLFAHENLGVAYFNKNQLDDAIKEFNIALQIDSNHASAHNNLGSAYTRKGLLDKAIEQYKEAVSLKPDFPEAHSNLGAVYVDKNQLDDAIKESSLALQINPNYAEAHNNLGTAYFRKGLLSKAIQEYKEAISLKPAYADAQNNLRAALEQEAQNKPRL
jgi:tetratricopeptide (TPR) repeat protein